MASTESATGGIVSLSNAERPVFDVVGTQVQLLAGKDRTAGAIDAVESRFPPGKGVPMHQHRFASESIYVLEGTMTIITRAGAIDAAEGSFLHAPTGVVHGFENRTGADARLLILWSPPLGPGAETVFSRLANIPPGPPDMSVIGPMLAEMDMHQP